MLHEIWSINEGVDNSTFETRHNVKRTTLPIRIWTERNEKEGDKINLPEDFHKFLEKDW